jgi:hypothetical protein
VERVRRGGVVLQVDGELRFVAVPLAVRVAPAPRTTAVPGAPAELVGIGVHEGAVIPVIAVGSGRGEMLVCQHAGELVGIVGGKVVRSGSFYVAPDRPDVVDVDGVYVPPLDVAAFYARVQSAARPGGRW